MTCIDQEPGIHMASFNGNSVSIIHIIHLGDYCGFVAHLDVAYHRFWCWTSVVILCVHMSKRKRS